MIQLTPREKQVVGLMARGTPNKQIAAKLRLTESTVKVYSSRIFDKIDVKDRQELILWAVSRRLIPDCGARMMTSTGDVACNMLEGHGGKNHAYYLPSGVCMMEWPA